MLAFYLSLIEGDEAKARFEQFYRRSYPRLWRVAWGILRSSELAEDAVHAAVIKIIDRHMEQFLKISQKSWDETEFWAVIIVRNTALNLLEKERRTVPMAGEWDAPAPNRAEDGAEYARLLELIQALPEIYRAVLEPKLVLEWDNAEIARAQGLSPSTVSTRAARGLKILREKLREEGYEDDGQRV